MSLPVIELLGRARELERSGRAVTACLLVKARGSTPQSAGSLMLVDDAAGTHGTIGGGCVEAEIRRRALAMLADHETGVLTFKLDHDYGWDDGMLCGGTLEVAVAGLPAPAILDRAIDDIRARRETSLAFDVATETGPARYTLRLPPRERLYVAGAGHVGQATARLALRLDFDVTIFDDRADLLERFAPDGAARDVGPIAEALAAAPVDGSTFCAIVTRGHRHDAQALAALVGRGARYLGMIGSRRKVRVTFDELIGRGVDPADLDAVDAPIGMDIGAVTVEEIALSIAAKLVAVRREGTRPAVEGPVPVAAATTR